jgi:predicted transcriptional regulator
MFYFDKYGNPVENQFSKKEVAAGVTKTVLDNYITAIGGLKPYKQLKLSQ